MPKTIVHRGIIEGFQGSWLSGLGGLVISGKLVYCENGTTVRALDAAFGEVIRGHSVNVEAIKGKDVVYGVDFVGVLEWFLPTREWRERWGNDNTPRIGRSKKVNLRNEDNYVND